MDLPTFNGARYNFVGYLVLDDDQMKNYPWEIPEDEEGTDPEEEKERPNNEEEKKDTDFDFDGQRWSVRRESVLKDDNYKHEQWFMNLN